MDNTTTEEKIKIVLNHMRLDFLLREIREEKTDNVRRQDFEAAFASRDKEVKIIKEIKESGSIIRELLNIKPPAEVSAGTIDATNNDSSTV